jgi:predicted nuclease with TOPRIM domain
MENKESTCARANVDGVLNRINADEKAYDVEQNKQINEEYEKLMKRYDDLIKKESVLVKDPFIKNLVQMAKDHYNMLLLEKNVYNVCNEHLKNEKVCKCCRAIN